MAHGRGFRSGRERGSAAVEFGLISIILISLIVFIIQFAIWFWAYQVGAHSAREAARAGAVDPCNNSAITSKAMDRLGGAYAPTPAPTVTVTRSALPVKVGDEVTVKVTFKTHEITSGFFPFALPAINKSATARVENVPASGGC